MPKRIKTQRICENGHTYFKSADCLTCPVCEKESRPDRGFLSLLFAPARRALENNGIHSLEQLSRLSEAEVLMLHGMGRTSIPILRRVLRSNRMSFRKE